MCLLLGFRPWMDSTERVLCCRPPPPKNSHTTYPQTNPHQKQFVALTEAYALLSSHATRLQYHFNGLAAAEATAAAAAAGVDGMSLMGGGVGGELGSCGVCV